MSGSVLLRNGKSFNCGEQESILDAAKRQAIVLEHSCKTGRCGVCKARVIAGEALLIQNELSLSIQDAAQGYVLTCCRAAAVDVQLDAEDLGELVDYPPKTLPCRIDSLEYKADDVLEVVLRTPPSNILKFLPGQYVNVIGESGLRRSYSIANAPRNDAKVVLQIRRIDNGLMSQYWFERAQINDLLRMEGPLGTFFLRNTDASVLIFLATGTGIAPIKGMLEQLANSSDGLHFKEIRLYWGGRVEKDIYWIPDFKGLPLKFFPVLSREAGWEGRSGYVQNAALDDNFPLKDSVVYACGSVKMIESAHALLSEAGLSNSKFYSDAFVSSE